MLSLLFGSLLGKLKLYAALLGAVIAAVSVVYFKGRREGASSVREEVNKRTTKVKERWNEIDNDGRTLDAALDKLRDDR